LARPRRSGLCSPVWCSPALKPSAQPPAPTAPEGLPVLDTLAARQPVAPDHEAEESVSTLVTRLVAESRDLAQAEVALYKAKAGERITAFRNAAVFFGAAAVLALSAVTALLVGLIMTLATLVGPGWATLIVVVGVLVIAGVLAMIGKGRLAPAKPGAAR